MDECTGRSNCQCDECLEYGLFIDDYNEHVIEWACQPLTFPEDKD